MAKKGSTGGKATKKVNIELNDFLDEIRVTAYHIYEERIRNNIPGTDLEDWLKAEEIVKKKYNIK